MLIAWPLYFIELSTFPGLIYHWSVIGEWGCIVGRPVGLFGATMFTPGVAGGGTGHHPSAYLSTAPAPHCDTGQRWIPSYKGGETLQKSTKTTKRWGQYESISHKTMGFQIAMEHAPCIKVLILLCFMTIENSNLTVTGPDLFILVITFYEGHRRLHKDWSQAATLKWPSVGNGTRMKREQLFGKIQFEVLVGFKIK